MIVRIGKFSGFDQVEFDLSNGVEFILKLENSKDLEVY